MNKRAKILWALAITVLVLAPLVYGMDWDQVRALALGLDLGLLGWAWGMFVLSIALQTWRLKRVSGEDAGAWPMFSVSTYHQFFLIMLPGRIGEVSLPVLMKNRLQRRGAHGVADLLHMRFDDLTLSALYVLVGILALPAAFKDTWSLTIGGVAFLGLGLFGRGLFRALLRRIRRWGRGFRGFLGRRKGNRLQLTLRRLERSYAQHSLSEVSLIFFIGLVVFVVSTLRIVLTFQAMGLDVGFLQGVLMLGVGNIAGMIPLRGFGGIGPRQYAIALALVSIGQPLSLAAGAALGLQLTVILFTVGLGALVFVLERVLTNGAKADKRENNV